MINQRYIVQKKLGEGRSKVFSVIDTEFPEKEIAMKILPPNVLQEEKDAFRQEYFTLQKLDHPNIIKAYDIGQILTVDEENQDIETSSSYITLERFDSVELIDCPSLDNKEQLISIIKQICSVLYYLHQSNYIYYDLKPQNVLVASCNDFPQVKVIDLGFARYILSDYDTKIRGTAEYIAPELLKKENHDHSIDLYSLGIILYRIIYGKLPFNAKTELDIYKAHIESEFEFPESNFSEKLINIVKKLLKKDPQERYTDSLQVLVDLGIEINIQLTKDFLPAKILSSRKDILNIVKTYLNDKNSNEIFSLRGFSGAGKSQVILELHSIYSQTVYVENSRRKTGVELIRFFLHKLLFNDDIFNSVSREDQEYIKQLFSTDEIEISDTLKALLTRVTENKKLLLMIDDYNLYDDFAKEAINEILQILQINKVKVIIAESSEFDYATEKLYNVQHINLTPFTDRQLSEYLDLSYYPNFPKHKLKKVILDYADLLPGSIVQFIKDILILGVMRYESGEVKFVYENNIEEALSGSNEEVYRLRLSNLSEDELRTAQLISAFNISVEQMVLASVLNKSSKEIEEILENLLYKNIINSLSLSNSPNIISDSFKKYIYDTIQEKKKYHLVIASLIKRILPGFNVIEHARQYELAGDVLKVVELINKEIKRAENLSAYSYKRKLIEDLLMLDVNDDIRTSLHIELIKTLYKLSDFNTVIECFGYLDFDTIDKNSQKDLIFVQGSSLISIRRIDEGIEKLNALLKSNLEPSTRQKVLVEIAYANFEKNNYKEAEEIALDLLNSENTLDEEKGRCYNLLGMIKVYVEEDLHSAIDKFSIALNMYQKAQLPRRVAGVELNIGNIYSMLGDSKKTEEHWDNALRINKSVGNLEQEAIMLVNYGNYYKHKFSFDKAVKQMMRSEQIFSSLGNENYRAIVLTNLGEVYLIICEYQKSSDCLTNAVDAFSRLENYEEQANALFDLGRLSYQLNDTNKLNKVIREYEICVEGKDFPPMFSLNLSILKTFNNLLSGGKSNWNEISNYLNEYLNTNEKRSFTELLILFVNQTPKITDDERSRVLDLLFSNNIQEDLENNFLLNAIREYFFGIIALKYKDKRLSPPIVHFEKAYSIIENQSITELTWRVLAAISESYLERGFINKAKKPIIYAAELLNYIADNIKKSDNRTNYLNDIERKKVFEGLKSFNKPAYVQ